MEVCIIYNFNVNPRCLISTDFRNHIISPLYLLYSNKNGLPYYYYLKPSVYIRPIDREDNDRAGVGFGRIG